MQQQRSHLLPLLLLLLLLLPHAAPFVLPSPSSRVLGRLAHHKVGTLLRPSSAAARASWPSPPSPSALAPLFATTTADGVLEGAGGTPSSGGGSSGGLRDKLGAFYRFTRPHTIRGTILASAMGVLRCLIENPKAFTLQPVPRALLVRKCVHVRAPTRSDDPLA